MVSLSNHGRPPRPFDKLKVRRSLYKEKTVGAAQAYPSGLCQARQGPTSLPFAGDLRIHCVQLFYNLSDPGMEDLLYEAESVRRFVGLKKG